MKRPRAFYPISSLKEAIKEVETGRISMKRAAFKHGVPRSTLRDKVNGRTAISVKSGAPAFLSEEEEQRLALWAVQLALDAKPCTEEQIQEMAQKIVQDDGRKTPFKNGKPGYSWMRGFFKRNPEVCPALGVEPLKTTTEEVNKWFTDLVAYLEDQNLVDVLELPNCIWTASETVIRISQKRGRCTMLTRQRVRSNNSERITFLPAVNASGISCPPLVCYPVPKRKEGWEPEEGPPDSWHKCSSEVGMLTPALFLFWLQYHFQPFIVATETRTPVLLFVDGHSNYITEEAGNFCAENGIILYRFPPNSGSRLDPFEQGFYANLKGHFSEEQSSWEDDHPLDALTKESVVPLFARAWDRAMESPEEIRNGFQTVGLYPVPNGYIKGKIVPEQVPEEGTPLKKGALKKTGTRRRCNYTLQDMLEAMRRVELGELNIQQAAKEYSIPSSSLNDKLKGRSVLGARRGPATYLTWQEEKDLSAWAIKMIMGGRKFTMHQLTEMAGKMIKSDGRVTPLVKDKPGNSWYRMFLQRNPEVKEAFAAVKLGSSAKDLDEWFLSLRSFLEEENTLSILEVPERMWSMSELIFPLHMRSGEIGAVENRGATQFRKRRITMVTAVSPSGAHCPPMVCYPVRRPPTSWKPLEGAPDSWTFACNYEGHFTEDLFLQWLKDHFHPYLVASGTHFPVLLLVHGYTSDCSDEAADFCAQNGIILNKMPAFAVTVLDPVEQTLTEPLREACTREVTYWKDNNPNQFLTKEKFTEVCSPAWEEVLSDPELVKAGFWDAGLFPFDGSFNRTKLDVDTDKKKPKTPKVGTSLRDMTTPSEASTSTRRELIPSTSGQSIGESVSVVSLDGSAIETVVEEPPAPSAFVDVGSDSHVEASPSLPAGKKGDTQTTTSNLSTAEQEEDILQQVMSTVGIVKATKEKQKAATLGVKTPFPKALKRKLEESCKIRRYQEKKRREREPTDDMQRARRDLNEAKQAVVNVQKDVQEALQYVKEVRKEAKRSKMRENNARQVMKDATKAAREAREEARRTRIELSDAETLLKVARNEARDARKSLAEVEHAFQEARVEYEESEVARADAIQVTVIDEEKCARCEGAFEKDDEESTWVTCDDCPRTFHVICTNMFHLPLQEIAKMDFKCPWCTYPVQ